MEKKNLLPMNLQFFAEDDGNQNDGNQGGENDDSKGNENGNEDQNSGDNSGEKTFTQTEVNNMMTKEKNEGKRSILKALGFKNENEAKQAIDNYNKYLESKKTDDEKKQEQIDNANIEKNEALKRASEAESKLACFELGVSKDYIDDVIAIASTKVTDDKDLASVLKEMKEDQKYSNFFSEVNSSNGTGGNPGHGQHKNDPEDNIGKRLASTKAKSKETKSSFFDN